VTRAALVPARAESWTWVGLTMSAALVWEDALSNLLIWQPFTMPTSSSTVPVASEMTAL
jgi:hypothetical protein